MLPLLLLLLLFPTGVIRRRTPDNRLSNAANPVVLFLFRVGIQKVSDLRRGNLKGVALAGFQIGRFDGSAQCQIDHPVGRRVLVGAIKEFAALEQKEAAAPVLQEMILN